MKINKFLVSAVLAATAALSARADVTIVLTGSTAFRAVINDAVKQILTGEVIAYDAAAANLNSANTAYFKGTIASQPGLGNVTVKTAWSGSGTGVIALKANSNVTVFADSVSSSATSGGAAVALSGNTVSATATFALSDVRQTSTTAPASPSLTGASVGVIPFRFLVSESITALLADGTNFPFSNITDQQIQALYSAGFAPLSYFTGNPNDAAVTVYPVGRDSGSGTRITVLAESGYGINNSVSQYQPTVSGGVITDLKSSTLGNGGYSSGGSIATVLGSTTSASLTDEGSPADANAVFVGYVGLSDALTAISAGAKALTYNGGVYSADGVANGSYTLWATEQLYNKVATLSSNESTFRTLLLSEIPNQLTSEVRGIPTSAMNVVRVSDGGPVSP